MKSKPQSPHHNNEELINRVREALMYMGNVEEKKMFRGTAFMVDGKMCISVGNNELLCRTDPADHETTIERTGCREMVHNGKVMKGYVFVSEEGFQRKKDFDYWIKTCLDFNPKAKASKK